MVMHRAHFDGFGVQGDQTRTRSGQLASNSICGWALGKEETGRSGEEFDPACGQRRVLFTDAEAREDPAEQVIGAEGASNFAQ
jgi:hypothetical protein